MLTFCIVSLSLTVCGHGFRDFGTGYIAPYEWPYSPYMARPLTQPYAGINTRVRNLNFYLHLQIRDAGVATTTGGGAAPPVTRVSTERETVTARQTAGGTTATRAAPRASCAAPTTARSSASSTTTRTTAATSAQPPSASRPRLGATGARGAGAARRAASG